MQWCPVNDTFVIWIWLIAWSAYTWYLRYVSFAPWRLENHIREKIGSAWHIGIFSRLSVLLLVSWFGAKASYWRDFRICSTFYDSYAGKIGHIGSSFKFSSKLWVKIQVQEKLGFPALPQVIDMKPDVTKSLILLPSVYCSKSLTDSECVGCQGSIIY